MVISNITNIMIKYFEGDVKRINHALKVYSFAKIIGELEQVSKADLFVLEISAVLHDIGIKISEQKYNSSNGKYQEIEGPPVAKELLGSFNLDSSIVDRVCYLIGNHHSYDKIDSVDFQILVEADFLVNIYEDEIPKDNIAIIEEKIFRTSSGKELLKSIYM
ncbi:HD domain-containing protein [Clostridium fungisolvens]|uniref:HD domain-containing protein n=1 Tax=Clostridium fungisolvens TaxID=1604897 RepID=A0A6V8SK35_9CLOT|nr:HD domain-containing protein [Clostridium fungisolvens]GFP76892.1 hypothetical protein bsdtw1_03002 [Clostridium fungisolvens]